jgi:hypothetical protein
MIKIITAATLTAALSLFLALPAAHAGGGMGAGSGVTTCRLVLNGSQNQPQIVSVSDALVSNDVVKVNALVLLCDLPATGVTQNVPATGSPIPAPPPPGKNPLACYTVTGADTARILTTIRDPFTEVNAVGGAEHVALGAIQLLCVPAAATNP